MTWGSGLQHRESGHSLSQNQVPQEGRPRLVLPDPFVVRHLRSTPSLSTSVSITTDSCATAPQGDRTSPDCNDYLSTWVESKNFYDALSWVWVDYREGYSTQLKNGDIIFMFFSKHLNIINERLCNLNKWQTGSSHTHNSLLLTQPPTSPQSSSPICVRVRVRVVGAVGTVEKVFLFASFLSRNIS